MSNIGEEKLQNKVSTESMKESLVGVNQEPVAAESPASTQQAPVGSLVTNQNGTGGGSGSDNGAIDLPMPVQTQGEASNTESSFIPRSLPLLPTVNLPSQSPVTPFSPGFGSNNSLNAQLTQEEQAAIYKKANILALSALAKKGGPNTKDLFAMQQKLQEFLTSLVNLAGQKGPQLKVIVQMLVQNLVAGKITEEEFATRIETDLNSQHQPSLLPFLKSSVPHLKTRLQLQQVIIKELIQRTVLEKKNVPVSTTSTSSTSLSDVNVVTTTPTTATTASSSLPSSSSSGTSLATGTTPQATPLITLTPRTSGVGPNVPKPVVIGSSVVSIGNQSMPTTAFVVSGALDNVNSQLPKMLSENIAKLPPEQRLMYIQQVLKSQHLISNKTVREKQQKLVQEQQVPLVMGVTRTPSAVGVVKSGCVASSVKVVASTGVGTARGGIGDKSKMSMKHSSSTLSVSPLATPHSGAAAAAIGKKKSRIKDTAGMDVEEEEEGMDILDEVGVNLQEETAQFLSKTVGDVTVTRSCKDIVFLNISRLRHKVEALMRVNGIQDVSEEVLVCLSHATQERLKDILEKLTEICRHRVEVLKDDNQYRMQSEVRNQLRILESIDRTVSKRKMERDNEQTLKAAKSRSKGADPEKAAKIREEAKQIQQDEAARLRNESANRTALAAIGRKRPLPPGDTSGCVTSSQSVMSDGVTGSTSLMTSSLFAPLASTRSPKRHVTSRDLIFYLEQERETRKSLSLYKTLLK